MHRLDFTEGWQNLPPPPDVVESKKPGLCRVNVNALAFELIAFPDQEFVDYLISGLSDGFRIGFEGLDVDFTAPNLKSALENVPLINLYLENEISLGRIAGPFDSKPMFPFRTNPIGVVPKKTPGKFRSILNLSYPKGNSVNDFIQKDDFSLTYVTVDKAIQYILELGSGCFLSKIDIQSQ